MSKRHYVEARDKSITDDDDGIPSKAIRMSDLKMELDMISLPKKKLLADRSVQHSSPFDYLPDEIVLKIMKMFAHGSSLYADFDYDATYSDVMNPIAKVSCRFNRIAKDRSLWTGRVMLDFQVPGELWAYVVLKSENYGDIRFQDVVDHAVKFCLHDNVRGLHFVDKEHSSTKLSQDQVRTIAEQCPRLETLILCFVTVDAWPTDLDDWKMNELSSPCLYCHKNLDHSVTIFYKL